MSEQPFGKGAGFWQDPVQCLDGVWGFWDETWASFHEPFPDEDAARKALRAYCDYLNGEGNA